MNCISAKQASFYGGPDDTCQIPSLQTCLFRAYNLENK